jgi:hypothetical protein
MVIGLYIFPTFGILCQEKSGNPATFSKFANLQPLMNVCRQVLF